MRFLVPNKPMKLPVACGARSLSVKRYTAAASHRALQGSTKSPPELPVAVRLAYFRALPFA